VAPVVTVRGADDGDIDALCALYLDFHEFHVEGVPSRLASLKGASRTETVALAARIRELISSADAAVLVAEHGEAIVGFAEVYVRDDEPSPARVARRHGHLQSMFVVSGQRNLGIGALLLAESESWARSKGAQELRVDIWQFAGDPLGFYESHGYRTIRRSLAKDLE
jgi:GNAT superfamily N-acetyltransferase